VNEDDVAKDGRRRWTLKMVQDVAISRGGFLISKVYKNTSDYLMWECGICLHQWPAALKHIKRGSWCPKCNLSVCTIDQAYEIAESKNGKCLTLREDFKNGEQKLQWECSCGYIWPASLSKVKNTGTWCPKCSGTKKFTYEEVKSEIELRGWELLTKENEYKNAKTKLKIKCKNKHLFKQSLDKILHRGYGCKYCDTTGVTENICRAYFEQIFNNLFPIVRPKYMERLELDGYCAELGIAFEHQGPQHYSLKGYQALHSSKTEEDFQALLERDARKIKLCDKFGIKLILIPDLFNKTKLKNLMSLIVDECTNLSINIPNEFIKINLSWVYNKNKRLNATIKNQLKELEGVHE